MLLHCLKIKKISLGKLKLLMYRYHPMVVTLEAPGKYV